MKKIKYLLVVFISFIIFAGCTQNAENREIDFEDGSCNVWVLDVDQGSSMLIEVDEKYMLIDGGDSDQSSYVVSFLKKQNVSELKYVIATHYDADHLNGVVGALNVFDVKNVICPEYTASSRVYNSFVTIINEKNINKISPLVGNTYSLGSASFTIISPNSSGYSNVNDYSVGIKFIYQGKSFIVAGDATNQSEQEIIHNGIDIKADVYIANHHGSSGSNSIELINKINPEYAIISAGEGNSYGHPTLQTLKRFRKQNIDIFRTDKQDEIHFVFNSKGIIFDKEPYNALEPGSNGERKENVREVDTEEKNMKIQKDEEEGNYILNKKTKKIHKSFCNSVNNMSETNKIYFNGTVEDAMKDGYETCKNCF